MARKPKGIDWNDSLAGFKSALTGVSNFVKQDLESQSATFVNPWINLAGKAVGKNPNLREAGTREALINTGMALAAIVTGGMAKSASTAARAAAASSRVPTRSAAQILPKELEKFGRASTVRDFSESSITKWSRRLSHPSYGGNTAGRSIGKTESVLQRYQIEKIKRQAEVDKIARRIQNLTRGQFFGE